MSPRSSRDGGTGATLACQYHKKLFASGKVVRYLTARHPDEYAALVKIVESTGVEP